LGFDSEGFLSLGRAFLACFFGFFSASGLPDPLNQFIRRASRPGVALSVRFGAGARVSGTTPVTAGCSIRFFGASPDIFARASLSSSSWGRR
jgi:hypothetical protein